MPQQGRTERYDLQFRRDDASSSVPAFVGALFPGLNSQAVRSG